ncbi:hypothetical protein R6Q59_025088 [Mikania micrantha]
MVGRGMAYFVEQARLLKIDMTYAVEDVEEEDNGMASFMTYAVEDVEEDLLASQLFWFLGCLFGLVLWFIPFLGLPQGFQRLVSFGLERGECIFDWRWLGLGLLVPFWLTGCCWTDSWAVWLLGVNGRLFICQGMLLSMDGWVRLRISPMLTWLSCLNFLATPIFDIYGAGVRVLCIEVHLYQKRIAIFGICLVARAAMRAVWVFIRVYRGWSFLGWIGEFIGWLWTPFYSLYWFFWVC